MSIWKFSSRWSDNGHAASSILYIFKKYEIVFAYEIPLVVKKDDVIVIADGLTIVGLGIALCDATPLENLRDESFEQDILKFCDNETAIAVRIRFMELTADEQFYYGKRGRFHGFPADRVDAALLAGLKESTENAVALAFEKFKQAHEELEKTIHEELSEPENNRFPMYDGALDIEGYFHSPIRIAWMLKEPYDGNKGVGGGLSLSGLFDTDEGVAEMMKSPSKATWHPIVYASYGILNDFKLWGNMDWIRDDPKMAHVLRSVAVINIQKLPSKNVTKTDWRDLQAAFPKSKAILEKQIKLLDPDIFVFGYTYGFYHELFDVKFEGKNYTIKDGKLYIWAYHPANRTITREQYVNEIVNAAKEWWETTRK